jgi:DNA-binding transcriptional MocR family regulator
MMVQFVISEALYIPPPTVPELLLIDNKLKLSDRFPTEQEMAEEFGVIRSCVREATKALNFLGIIEGARRRWYRKDCCVAALESLGQTDV